MNRRQFVRLSALAGVAAAVPSLRSPTKRIRNSADAIVVVGAGLAGLHAARVLRAAGREVVVLEARAFAGGRVQTVRTFDDGLHAEAGPIRIKGRHRTVLALAREFGLRLAPFAPPAGSPLVSIHGVSARADRPLHPARWQLELKPAERGLSPRDLLEHYLRDLPSDLADPRPYVASAAWQAYDRMTWPEWLKSRGASRAAVTLMTIGADSTELSALYVLRQIALLRSAGELDLKITGGMDLLPRALAASLGDTVHYNAAVVRLHRGANEVKVDYEQHGQARSITASRVILTIPFSTLRQIEVLPPFSRDKERAIEDLPYFPATRFLIQSRTRFWRESGLSGYARTDRSAEIWDCTHNLPGARGILGVTASGAAVSAVCEQSPEKSVAFGKNLVADVYPEIAANFERGSVHCWAQEPWSRGAFAVLHPGQGASIMAHIATPEDRVHFAGEHTSSWMGWMEGALQSGERAAREVIASRMQ